jgi:hypothetical protein
MLIVGVLKEPLSCYYNSAEDSWELLLDSESESRKRQAVFKNYKYYFKGKLYNNLGTLIADNGYDFYTPVNISPIGVKFLFKKRRLVLQ